MVWQRYDAVLAIDHVDEQCWLVGDSEAACQNLKRRLDAEGDRSAECAIGTLSVDGAEAHRAAIVDALRYIASGDVYEVNLARKWMAQFVGQPLALWNAMRAASHVPLGMYFDAGDHSVLACTMERFLKWDASTRALLTRPIKGTLKRVAGDLDGPRRLRNDPKEHAEHSMIVDLMRNDIGRVAEIGSVEVRKPLVVEPFTGLYHLVSTVGCTTRPGVGVREILEATFPPGSVTGAPKIGAVEIIEELERHPRGIYCGAVGFVDRAGGLALAVAIRTATVRDGSVEYWAGGGIVEASDPDREVAETELKARVFLDAVASLPGLATAEARQVAHAQSKISTT